MRGIPETTTQGGIVKKLTLSTAAAALVLLLVGGGAFAATSATPKPKPIAFVGAYAGTASYQQNDTTVALTANGTGTGTLIGAGKITGTGVANTAGQPACVPFTGTGKVTGPGGTIIFKVIPGTSGCGDQAAENFTISGKATLLKATGKLLKRKGLLRMTGTYDKTSGAFTVKFRGSLTK